MTVIGISYKKLSAADKQVLRDEIGACEICEKVDGLVIDHCHESGAVRGVLCGSCNLKIGWIEGLNHGWVKRAARYLRVEQSKDWLMTREYELLKLLQGRFERDNRKWIDELTELEQRQRELYAQLDKNQRRAEVIELRLGKKSGDDEL